VGCACPTAAGRAVGSDRLGVAGEFVSARLHPSITGVREMPSLSGDQGGEDLVGVDAPRLPEG